MSQIGNIAGKMQVPAKSNLGYSPKSGDAGMISIHVKSRIRNTSDIGRDLIRSIQGLVASQIRISEFSGAVYGA
jgi:hypothetical protein